MLFLKTFLPSILKKFMNGMIIDYYTIKGCINDLFRLYHGGKQGWKAIMKLSRTPFSSHFQNINKLKFSMKRKVLHFKGLMYAGELKKERMYDDQIISHWIISQNIWFITFLYSYFRSANLSDHDMFERGLKLTFEYIYCI